MGNQSRQSCRGLLQCKYYCDTFVWILLNVMFTSNLPVQLISSVDPKFLKLTKMDDQIYKVFREGFKDFEIKLLKEEDLKSDKAKGVGINVGICPVSPELQWRLSVSVVLRHRHGVPSATSSKAWWKTSTTALCSVWTARGTTQRRIPYLVRVRHLRSAFKESKTQETHICNTFPVFSHQDSVLGD